jgi:hypothetical protein
MNIKNAFVIKLVKVNIYYLLKLILAICRMKHTYIKH